MSSHDLQNWPNDEEEEDDIEITPPYVVRCPFQRGKDLEITPRHAVITGATDSLGAHVVAKLAVDERIDCVYCLISGSSGAEGTARLRTSPLRASMNFYSSVSTYSQAAALCKALAEQVCFHAASHGVTARVLRVGRIAVDLQREIGNAYHDMAIILRAAVSIRALSRPEELFT
ncbi:hypothetical protein B0T10DRAFT_465059 [Thelonectria olida]|uniref:Thioester reductase (TE) domain-containing protein n=1 Tax=Thelonectria olida TaxID=1576542 RepID=A0A9P8VVZ4_9HYPO|nr:hypothetical protein B0T10DRAFT_465059 [Thelonectria olida]